MARFKNPYDYTADDFTFYSNENSFDLVDSSGYLNLKDQISIILSQSEINNEFRRGMIDRYNTDKEEYINSLSSFEENEYVNDQLYYARSGDLIDKQTILTNAYNNGFSAGFYHQNRGNDLGDSSTLGADGDKIEPDVSDNTSDDK